MIACRATFILKQQSAMLATDPAIDGRLSLHASIWHAKTRSAFQLGAHTLSQLVAEVMLVFLI